MDHSPIYNSADVLRFAGLLRDGGYVDTTNLQEFFDSLSEKDGVLHFTPVGTATAKTPVSFHDAVNQLKTALNQAYGRAVASRKNDIVHASDMTVSSSPKMDDAWKQIMKSKIRTEIKSCIETASEKIVYEDDTYGARQMARQMRLVKGKE